MDGYTWTEKKTACMHDAWRVSRPLLYVLEILADDKVRQPLFLCMDDMVDALITRTVSHMRAWLRPM